MVGRHILEPRRQRRVHRYRYRHRHRILVGQAVRVRHPECERQGGRFGHRGRYGEGRRSRAGVRQRPHLTARLRPGVGQGVARVRIASLTVQRHGRAGRDAGLVGARIGGGRVVGVRQRHRQVRRVRQVAVADLDRDRVAAVRIVVVGVLEVLRRHERQHAGGTERELAAVRPARGARRNRPGEISGRRIGIGRCQRRHRRLVLRGPQARRAGDDRRFGRLTARHRHGVVVVQAARVRHPEPESQDGRLVERGRRGEGRRSGIIAHQRHGRPARLRPGVDQGVARVQIIASRTAQRHGRARLDSELARARIGGGRLVDLRQRHRQVRRARQAVAVANLHRDLVDAVAIGVVGVLEVLRRHERQRAGGTERELAAVRPARGARRNRPGERAVRRLDIARCQRRHRRLVLRGREARRSGHPRHRTSHRDAGRGGQPPSIGRTRHTIRLQAASLVGSVMVTSPLPSGVTSTLQPTLLPDISRPWPVTVPPVSVSMTLIALAFRRTFSLKRRCTMNSDSSHHGCSAHSQTAPSTEGPTSPSPSPCPRGTGRPRRSPGA